MPAWVGEYNRDYFNHAERLTHLNCGRTTAQAGDTARDPGLWMMTKEKVS